MAAPKPERRGGSGAPKKDATEEGWVAARAMYESTPGITLAQVAAKCGVTHARIVKRATDEGWVKCLARPDNSRLNAEAHKIADTYVRKVADLGPEVTEADKAKAADEVVTQTAAEQRAQVLDRHRKEWNTPRVLSIEAVKGRDFERAKLAKITSETLKLIQEGERKAWGMDSGGENSVTVVIERG